MTSTTAAQRLSDVRSRVYDDCRVSLSEFARGKGWRDKLERNGFMELLEHGERTAWVISEAGMRDMLDYISELEKQAEQSSVRAMFEAREGREDWMSGSELSQVARDYFIEHADALTRAASHG